MLRKPFARLRNVTIALVLLVGIASSALAAPTAAAIGRVEGEIGIVINARLYASPMVDPNRSYRGLGHLVLGMETLIEIAEQLLRLAGPRPGDPLTLHPA